MFLKKEIRKKHGNFCSGEGGQISLKRSTSNKDPASQNSLYLCLIAHCSLPIAHFVCGPTRTCPDSYRDWDQLVVAGKKRRTYIRKFFKIFEIFPVFHFLNMFLN